MSFEIPFVKYQGTGNDFVVINALSGQEVPEDTVAFAQAVCDRHFGVGSDGLIILKPHKDLDFYMDFYNPDGSQSFCGNGSRCAVHYFVSLTGETGNLSFEAIDGPHEAQVHGEEVAIKMAVYGRIAQKNEDMILNTGSPHYLVFADELPGEEIVEKARLIRYSDEFKQEGINVNFVEIRGYEAHVQTYERGVENETLSCGTGVTAVALGAALKADLQSPVKILTKGGNLSVSFNRSGSEFFEIYLKGPAVKVFDGIWEVK